MYLECMRRQTKQTMAAKHINFIKHVKTWKIYCSTDRNDMCPFLQFQSCLCRCLRSFEGHRNNYHNTMTDTKRHQYSSDIFMTAKICRGTELQFWLEHNPHLKQRDLYVDQPMLSGISICPVTVHPCDQPTTNQPRNHILIATWALCTFRVRRHHNNIYNYNI